MSKRSAEAARRVREEWSDIYEYELDLEYQGVRQRLTVVRSRIEAAFEELSGILSELMEDPLYEEMCTDILENNTKTINDLRALEERLEEELELLACHASSIELVNSYGHGDGRVRAGR